MKELNTMKDSMSTNEETIREMSLMMEEAYFYNTINAFVELIVLYGSAKVLDGLDDVMKGKTT
jgi:hypothetical protein